MSKLQFKVMEGGLGKTPLNENYKFTSAYVTNTRLMGVIVVYINWENKLHQFFYFDIEEYGLDTYKSVRSNNKALIQDIENSLIGGLGGQKISIDENEAISLVKKFVAHNLSEGISLPGSIEECEFFLSKDITLNQEQRQALTQKLCVKIKTPYEAINYFLMRLWGKDYEGAQIVSTGINVHQCVDVEFPCTLLKNSIDIDIDDLNSFKCTSLIDNNLGYQVIVCHLSVKNLKVTNFELISTLDISPIEASMMLAQNEYVDLFKTKEPLPVSILLDTPFTAKAMRTEHKQGVTYMIFNPDNSHVNNSVYRLSGDVLGVYYATNSGQIIVSANSLANIHALEKDLSSWKLKDTLIPTGQYQFDKPVLSDFMKSDLDDFEKYIKLIAKKE